MVWPRVFIDEVKKILDVCFTKEKLNIEFLKDLYGAIKGREAFNELSIYLLGKLMLFLGGDVDYRLEAIYKEADCIALLMDIHKSRH